MVTHQRARVAERERERERQPREREREREKERICTSNKSQRLEMRRAQLV